MDFNEVKELIALIDSSNLRSFELSNNGALIKMSKNTFEQAASQQVATQNAPVATAVANTAEAVEEVKKNIAGNGVKAPIVGTFYASASPDKPNFVSVGSKVKKGDVLCIIEAMKVMNEVVSEFDGEVVEICAGDGDLVEYGMVLFTIA